MNKYKYFIVRLSIALLLLCVEACNNSHDELSCPLDCFASATAIDSTESDDGNLKIYTATFPSDGNVRQYKTIVIYRTSEGMKVVDRRSILDIANKTSYDCYLPVERIYQQMAKGGTTYVVQLDNMESTAHDNSMLVALQISDNSLKPVNTFRTESQDTYIIEGDKKANKQTEL